MEQPLEPDHQLTPEQIKRLQEERRFIEEFISIMVHETRTSASVIVLYSELLLKSEMGLLNNDQRETLIHMKESGLFLTKIWGELSMVSHILSAKLDLYLEEVEIDQVIQEAISATGTHWSISWKPNKPLIEPNLPPDLPQIWVDVLRMRQALTCLFTESVNATLHKGDRKIVLTAAHDRDWVTLTVTTTGGEPIELHTYPAPPLFLSRTIIEKHGGQLDIIKSEPSELIISVTLPIRQNKPSSP